MTALQICKAALEEIGAVQYCDACSLNRSCRSGCPGDKARAALEAAAKVGDDPTTELLEMVEVVITWLRLDADPAPGASAGMADQLQRAIDAYLRGAR